MSDAQQRALAVKAGFSRAKLLQFVTNKLPVQGHKHQKPTVATSRKEKEGVKSVEAIDTVVKVK